MTGMCTAAILFFEGVHVSQNLILRGTPHVPYLNMMNRARSLLFKIQKGFYIQLFCDMFYLEVHSSHFSFVQILMF